MNWDVYAPFVVYLAALFGLLTGSFLNVVIYRVPVMMERGWTLFAKEHLQLELTEAEKQPFNLLKPDSRCQHCGTPIKPWQNIPVISYILLRGQCGSCQTPISIRYPAIELLTAVMFAVVAIVYGWSWLTLTGLVLTAFLIALTFIDADTQYLPDQLTLPLVWLGLLANSFLSSSFYRCSTSTNKMKGNYLSLCFINSFSVVKPIMVDAISRKSIALASRLKKAISISTINSRSSIFFASRESTMIWLHIRLWKLYPRTSIA